MFRQLKSNIKLTHKAKRRVVVFFGIVVFSVLAFTLGVGASTLQSAVEAKLFTPVSNLATNIKVMSGNPAKATTVRVEVVRNGEVVCSAPELNISDTDNYTESKPMSSCPPLRDDDVFRAIWQQTNEIKISYSGK